MFRTHSTTVHGGYTAARTMAERGWRVYAGVRTDADAERMAEHRGVTPVMLDITNTEHLAKLPSLLPDRLDAVVNNAGVAVGGPIETLALNDLRRQFEVNVIGGIGVTQTGYARWWRSNSYVEIDV